MSSLVELVVPFNIRRVSSIARLRRISLIFGRVPPEYSGKGTPDAKGDWENRPLPAAESEDAVQGSSGNKHRETYEGISSLDLPFTIKNEKR